MTQVEKEGKKELDNRMFIHVYSYSVCSGRIKASLPRSPVPSRPLKSVTLSLLFLYITPGGIFTLLSFLPVIPTFLFQEPEEKAKVVSRADEGRKEGKRGGICGMLSGNETSRDVQGGNERRTSEDSAPDDAARCQENDDSFFLSFLRSLYQEIWPLSGSFSWVYHGTTKREGERAISRERDAKMKKKPRVLLM